MPQSWHHTPQKDPINFHKRVPKLRCWSLGLWGASYNRYLKTTVKTCPASARPWEAGKWEDPFFGAFLGLNVVLKHLKHQNLFLGGIKLNSQVSQLMVLMTTRNFILRCLKTLWCVQPAGILHLVKKRSKWHISSLPLSFLFTAKTFCYLSHQLTGTSMSSVAHGWYSWFLESHSAFVSLLCSFRLMKYGSWDTGIIILWAGWTSKFTVILCLFQEVFVRHCRWQFQKVIISFPKEFHHV